MGLITKCESCKKNEECTHVDDMWLCSSCLTKLIRALTNTVSRLKEQLELDRDTITLLQAQLEAAKKGELIVEDGEKG